MKNKIILSAIGLCLASSLSATSLFSDSFNTNFDKEIEKFFNEDSFFAIPSSRYKINILNSTYPKMNLFENDKKYTFEFELAGIDKENIKVSIDEHNILKVSGEKKELTKDEKKDMVRQERFYGSFSRSISLPDDIDREKIAVTHNNGILKVVVTKDSKKIKNKVKILPIN